MSIAPASPTDPTTALSRLSAMNAALRELDPDAQVALDPDGGKLKVLTVLPPVQVMAVLQALGETAELSGDAYAEEADEARGTNTGGSCGCGCRRS